MMCEGADPWIGRAGISERDASFDLFGNFGRSSSDAELTGARSIFDEAGQNVGRLTINLGATRKVKLAMGAGGMIGRRSNQTTDQWVS